MSPAQLFSLCNVLVIPGWLLLIIAPRWLWTTRIITGIIVTLLAMVYVYFISQTLNSSNLKSFGTLTGVMQLFTQEKAVLAGWLHYLAFDLMVGLFEVKNAIKNRIHHGLVILCLVFTFMLGPLGLLLYFIFRIIKTKKYFITNYAQK